MEELSDDIICYIVSFIDVKSVFKFLATSKRFYGITKRKIFWVNLLYRFSSFPYGYYHHEKSQNGKMYLNKKIKVDISRSNYEYLRQIFIHKYLPKAIISECFVLYADDRNNFTNGLKIIPTFNHKFLIIDRDPGHVLSFDDETNKYDYVDEYCEYYNDEKYFQFYFQDFNVTKLFLFNHVPTVPKKYKCFSSYEINEMYQDSLQQFISHLYSNYITFSKIVFKFSSDYGWILNIEDFHIVSPMHKYIENTLVEIIKPSNVNAGKLPNNEILAISKLQLTIDPSYKTFTPIHHDGYRFSFSKNGDILFPSNDDIINSLIQQDPFNEGRPSHTCRIKHPSRLVAIKNFSLTL